MHYWKPKLTGKSSSGLWLFFFSVTLKRPSLQSSQRERYIVLLAARLVNVEKTKYYQIQNKKGHKYLFYDIVFKLCASEASNFSEYHKIVSYIRFKYILEIQIHFRSSNTFYKFKYILEIQIHLRNSITFWNFKYILEIQIHLRNSITFWKFKYIWEIQLHFGISNTFWKLLASLALYKNETF